MALAGPAPRGVAYRLGRYEAFFSLTSGGMAEVHLARTATDPPRLVVVKTLPEQYLSDQDRIDMFLDEMRVGRLLRHPNLVKFIEGDIVEGEPFIVLEYVDGPSLRELASDARTQGTPMDLQLAISIAVSVCDGLHYAHLAVDRDGTPLNLVHRDVSMRNIMVDRRGSVRILDFGVALAEGRRHETQGRSVKGKIAYTAPEYIAGHTPDPRADVFAFGVVLWELLTSRRLFSGATMAETVMAVLKGPVPLPSVYNPLVPPSLDLAVRGALHRKVEARWSSAAVFRDALFPAAHVLGGILSPGEIALRLGSHYPEVMSRDLQLRAEMSKDELSSKAVQIRQVIQEAGSGMRDARLDTAVEVDIELDHLGVAPAPVASFKDESVPDLEISEDVLEEDDDW